MSKINSRALLTDDEWAAIKGLSGVSDAARREIEDVIAFMRGRPEHARPWVREFRQARDANQLARTALSQAALPALERLLLSEVPVFMDRPIPSPPGTLRAISAARPIIEKAIAAVREVVERLPPDKVIPRAAGGRPRGPLGMALYQLDDILMQNTGRGLTQSRKSIAIAKTICEKSMPGVSEDVIVKHIKAIKRARRASSSE